MGLGRGFQGNRREWSFWRHRNRNAWIGLGEVLVLEVAVTNREKSLNC